MMMGVRQPPMSPMSWYWGSHETPETACSSRFKWSYAMAWTLWMILEWLTMTPLGSLVEPEVYCKKRRGLGASATGAPPNPRVSSVVTQRSGGSSKSACWGGTSSRWAGGESEGFGGPGGGGGGRRPDGGEPYRRAGAAPPREPMATGR